MSESSQPASAESSQPASAESLWQAFLSPPDEARPRAWWHWMDGNVDPDGIVRDLDWLHEVGVRGVQLFDGGMGGPLVVPAPVRPGSAAWQEAVSAAVTRAADLGLELAVATSSGWSAAGGPWVQPGDAMKKVVWSESAVTGGGHVEIALPPLPSVAGPYQDGPRWGAAERPAFAVDWRVIAFPADAAHAVLTPGTLRASGTVGDDLSCLTDGSFARTVSLARDPDGWSEAWIEQEFAEPVTVQSVVVGLPGPRGFGAAPAPDAVLQASDDGVRYRDVAALPPTTVPARTASFPPVTARWFRLLLSGASAADALPPVAEGVRRPPVLRKAHTFEVSEFALRAGGRIDHAEVKAGFGVVPDYYAVPTDPRVEAGRIDPASIVDVTEQVRDGVLRWDAPPGRWTLLRLGASLTGQTNGPAPADTTGLEVDKLDGDRVRAYLDVHLARFGDGFSALLSDSIESGSQNWTNGIHEAFRELRGYDPLPWLPTLAGYIVGDAGASDRFLYDYRRTIADLLAREYYGTLADEAHRRGMVYYAEALEDKRPQLGDDLAMRSHADVPMGAMWTFDPESGPLPTYVADLKGAASIAHLQGKRWVGAEAFTSFDRPWSSTPARLKHVADLQLTLGVTRFCIHTSPHQPVAAPPPGIALAPFLGQAFTRNETWSDMAGPWIDYLARCSAVLSQGEPAVDIAVFVGEEAPVTGLFGHRRDTAVPPGFDFDYIGADGLALLGVEEGTIVSAGARYRLLYLGGSSRYLTIATLGRIRELLEAGATVVGPRPDGSPSLADDPLAFSQLCDDIWAESRATGRVIANPDLAAALDELALRPALVLDGPPLRRISRIIDGARVTFVANPSPEPASVRIAVPPESGPLVAWDPVALHRRALPPVEAASCDSRTFALELPPFGSGFVLSGTPPRENGSSRFLPVEGAWVLALPGHPRHELGEPPRLWTDASPSTRGFSGTGVYSVEFEVAEDVASAQSVELELDEVRDIARITLNGIDCGVAWTPPFRVDVTAAVQAGRNRLEVSVATPWRNRLIAEAGQPSGEIFEPMTGVFEPTADPLPAGLRGAVRLLVSR